MSKYHSTISRRDFMKALGLGGIGIGASTAFGSAIGSSGATIFRDLDEAKASPQASFKRPSWVKEVNKPTIEMAKHVTF
jgi:epoxyqueuosine reductase